MGRGLAQPRAADFCMCASLSLSWPGGVEPTPLNENAGGVCLLVGASGFCPAVPIPTRSVVSGARVLFGTPVLYAAMFNSNLKQLTCPNQM